MVTALLTSKVFWLFVSAGGLGTLTILLGRSVRKWIEDKRIRDEHEAEIDILKAQRDGSVHSVADADRLWDDFDKAR